MDQRIRVIGSGISGWWMESLVCVTPALLGTLSSGQMSWKKREKKKKAGMQYFHPSESLEESARARLWLMMNDWEAKSNCIRPELRFSCTIIRMRPPPPRPSYGDYSWRGLCGWMPLSKCADRPLIFIQPLFCNKCPLTLWPPRADDAACLNKNVYDSGSFQDTLGYSDE